jgi:hypothetical protein
VSRQRAGESVGGPGGRPESAGFATLYPTKKSLQALENLGLKKIYPTEFKAADNALVFCWEAQGTQ